ncbi:MAG: hypothetical protein WBH50_02475 [Fuerstiella sp.]
MSTIRNLSLVLVAGVFALCTGCVPGQRLLTVQIEKDGAVVYEGFHGVPDTTPVPDMWDVLEDIPFEPIETGGDNADAKDGAKQTLDGSIIVRIKHVDAVVATSELESLTITSNEDGWSLDGDQVSRIKDSAK